MVPPTICQAQSASSIFANNELSLASVQVYGFDYDYTLAFYSNELHAKIFSTALDILLSEYKYPEELRAYAYLPGFAIRGLHYDVQKALLMKIDAFHYIQPGTVYRGLSPVSEEEVRSLYDGTHVPLDQMSDFYGKGSSMKQFMDIFSLPEMMLLSCVNDYFLSNNIDYDPVHLYKDVTDSVKDVHTRGVMYKLIEKDLERYILHGKETHDILHKLTASGKKLFLITNSPFSFVDKGMRYMVGKDWRDLFDVVIVKADKPSFFNDKRKPFRRLDAQGGLQWDRITALHKGEVYKQGNLYEFMRLTGWVGSHVLYFGDHIYSDLAVEAEQGGSYCDIGHSAADPTAVATRTSSAAITSATAVPPLLLLLLRQDLTLRHGWRTGAIIPELRDEINTINSAEYTRQLTWLQALTGLIDRMQVSQQVYRSPECLEVVQEWDRERQELRTVTKSLFNPQFGSLFRTHQNPTYFNRRLSRFADVYMTCVSCLLNYDLQHTFFPRRAPLQHEAPLWLDQLCIGCLGLPRREPAASAAAAGPTAATQQERQ
ncbi:5'-nucleotidase domain-containing protein 2-like isoform X6 [Petromyzon marinus]